MKYQVVERFRDKYTNEIYEKGAVVDFNTDRANEILEVGKFITEVEKPVKTVKNTSKKRKTNK